MKEDKKTRVCPVEAAGGLDNSFRKIVQNPQKILKPFINPNSNVLDLGCGPGFFSVEIAKMLKGSAKVIAADLQQGMLDKVKKKIEGTELENRISLHKCLDNSINLNEKVDFILAFYMVHEVPDKEHFFKELKSILNANSSVLIVEPKFHVTKINFENMLEIAKRYGFRVKKEPKFLFSRSVLLSN